MEGEVKNGEWEEGNRRESRKRRRNGMKELLI